MCGNFSDPDPISYRVALPPIELSGTLDYPENEKQGIIFKPTRCYQARPDGSF